MLPNHKKQPRQRNRPRNKANRIRNELQTIQNNSNCMSSANWNVLKQEITEAKEPNSLPQIAQYENDFKGETINGNSTIKGTEIPALYAGELLTASFTSNHINYIDESSLHDEIAITKTAAAEAEAATTKTKPSTLKNSDEAIKVIQQALRAKLLIKQTKLPTTEETRTPAISEVTNVNSSLVMNNKKSKLKEKCVENDKLKSAFLVHLQREMDNVMTNFSTNISTNHLLGNLQKLMNQEPISDVESSDDEDEYIEYIYKPRQYFLFSLCNQCKCDLIQCSEVYECRRCRMTYYCSEEHMKMNSEHRKLCYALRQVADSSDGHIFYKCGEFTTEQFRMYRIVTIRKVEVVINRSLTASEQEIILFPRICNDTNCREYRFNKLVICKQCGQVAYCKNNTKHLNECHDLWCQHFQMFKKLILFQDKFGRLDPSLPNRILKDIPINCHTTKQIFSKLGLDINTDCEEFAALSQISTIPLSAWYALKLCNQLKNHEIMTIHLIGAEIEFEVNALHKWEMFFLHITPQVKQLNIVLIGPELNPHNISFEQLKKTKCCRICRKSDRTLHYYFENKFYHEYCTSKDFLKPDLICFFNAGLYRYTGYKMEDTWPETILAAASFKCPVVVTSYTSHEAPMDMTRFVQECNRCLNVVLPPTINPFASNKPERNFISDESAPLIFKNYYCFVIE